jgi:ProP effector
MLILLGANIFMSNGSLKEQLQALSLGSTEQPTTPKMKEGKASHPKHPPKRPEKQMHTERDKEKDKEKNSSKQKPAWLEYAQYGVELLKAHFPKCFHDIKDIQPLKVGIKQDLVKLLGTREDIVIGDKACMVTSLAYYVNSISYLKNIIAGAPRIDLDGNPAGVVSAEEAQYSIDSRKAKLLKKKVPEKQSKVSVEENS